MICLDTEIQAAVLKERERIAQALEADADICANYNVMATIRSCAQRVRSGIPNSFIDGEAYCKRTKDGNHLWAEVCAACGQVKDNIEDDGFILEADYLPHLTLVSRLEAKCMELDKQISELKIK